MTTKKGTSYHWILLPILFSSASVLAGGYGVAGYETPSATEQAIALSSEQDGFLDDSQEVNSTNMNYVGGNTRIGVGIDTEFKGRVDGSHIFLETENAVTSAEGWLGINPAADGDDEEIVTGVGAKVNHNWVARDESGSPSHVNKVFGAYDQNEAKDKKITAGYGQEREDMFWSGHVSKGLSDKRVSGKVEGGDYHGANVYEKAYDYGVGGRVGAFVGDQLMRVQGGLDFEWGTENADSEDMPSQLSVSGGVEKFFANSPHSIGANVELSKKNGGYTGDDHDADVSGNVNYRYDFGGSGLFASEEQYRRVRVEIPGKTEVVKVKKKRPPKLERKLVKHTMELEADTFFKVNDYRLTPQAQQRLRTMMGRIRQTGHHGNIRITGNTCDVGTYESNQLLSERRASQVRSFMAANGFNPNELQAIGLGETQPKYPNVDATRHRNRRVDIEYVAYQSNYKDKVIEQGYDIEEKVRVISEPRVVWRRELIQAPPSWVGQALRNNIQYKQTIDTYRTLGSGAVPIHQNGAPVVVDDHAATLTGETIMIDVLANDSDPDGDRLSFSSHDTTTANGGTVTTTNDAGKLIYTSAANFIGTDTFTYTVTDNNGNTRIANVTVVVTAPTTDDLTASDDGATTPINTSVTVDVLANDSDTAGHTISIQSYPDSSENGGTITLQNGKLVYAPFTDFTGTDTFVYTITDDNGNTDSATVTITVTAAATSGVIAVNDTASTKANTGIAVDVLGNDSDPDGGTFGIQSFESATSNGGAIAQEGDLLVYTPAAGYSGTDTFTYTIIDSDNESATATVTITIEEDEVVTVLSPEDDAYTVTPSDLDDNAQVALSVLNNDTYEGNVSIRIISYPSLGSLQNVNASNGDVSGDFVTYKPNSGAVGEDTFTYVLVDADGNVSSPATVTINLPSVPTGNTLQLTDDGTGGDMPGDTYSFYSNDTVTRQMDVLVNDVGDEMEIIAITTPPRFGTATISSDGQSVNYTLRSGYCEDHYFVYKVRDKHGNEAEARVYVNIVND